MLTPLSPAQWDADKAAHLLNRAGFGGTPAHVDSLARSGMAASVRYLVDGPAAPAPAPAPDWAQPTDYPALREKVQAAVTAAPTPVDEAGRQAVRRRVLNEHRKQEFNHLLDLDWWWLDRMRQSVDPLEEKMTLFWHGHFATSAQKVKDPYFMYLQNQTLREHARGNFGVLVKAISRDPAMIEWLDLRQSRAAHPNENFAREVMELFTLGEGHYTEKDVTEGARAFTGYRINGRDASFQFNPRDHDNTPKTVLGRNDLRDGDQVIDQILTQPACAHFMANKLWTFFVQDNASPALVDALADTLRANNYEMRPVLHQMFTSQEFYSAEAMRTQIKSPVQWIVQNTRMLEIDLPPKGPLMNALRQMGQVPFYPPSVKGWDGGKTWISTSTLLTRYNLAAALLRSTAPRAVAAAVPDFAPGINPAVTMAGGETLDAKGNPVAATAVRPEPPALPSGQIDLQKLAPPDVRGNADMLVNALTQRLFQGPLAPKVHDTFTDYLHSLGGLYNDQHVVGLIHLMMSTPYFQLC